MEDNTMTNKEICTELEEAWELDEDTLTADTVLDQLDAWDSMAKLSLMAVADDHGKKLTGDKIATFKTIGDIINFLA